MSLARTQFVFKVLLMFSWLNLCMWNPQVPKGQGEGYFFAHKCTTQFLMVSGFQITMCHNKCQKVYSCFHKGDHVKRNIHTFSKVLKVIVMLLGIFKDTGNCQVLGRKRKRQVPAEPGSTPWESLYSGSCEDGVLPKPGQLSKTPFQNIK